MTEPVAAPPPSYRQDLVEVLHGRPVADPYRWLEDGDSAETLAWVDAQNAFTRTILDAAPDRTTIAERLAALLSIGDISSPSPRGPRRFFIRRQGSENQARLLLRDASGAGERELLNPNALDANGLVSLDWWYPSPDGSLVAYGLSHGGDEQSTLRVLDVATCSDLPDVIGRTRAASVAWLPDSSGFFYTRYPEARDVPPGEESYHRHVYVHRMGAQPATDELIFGEGRTAEDWPSVHSSPDGRYLLVIVNRGWDASDCYVRDARGHWVTVIEGEQALSDGEIAGSTLYLRTNLNAPNYRVVAVDLDSPERRYWREIVPERRDVLEQARLADGHLLLAYLRDASSHLECSALDGSELHEIPLPAIGTVYGLQGEWAEHDAFFAFSSFAIPPRVYRYEPATGRLSAWDAVEVLDGDDDFEVSREHCSSADGTTIPMFIVSRRGLTRDNARPTVLTGYGGFNISMTPTFSRALRFWLELGGVYVVANLRGGSEFGEAWHQAGMLANKQNVFDDFTAAAKHLFGAGYTRPARLAISGGSNGGLLVGAAVTQAPDLFQAAVCAVPLLDMLRYHRFRIARLWIAEYGSADDAEQFRWLEGYSPYHHVGNSVSYPAMLLLTGDGDSRVDPMHARKMAAQLQSESNHGGPILLRVDHDSGHGAGRPISKTLAEQVDIWAFICWQLGVDAA